MLLLQSPHRMVEGKWRNHSLSPFQIYQAQCLESGHRIRDFSRVPWVVFASHLLSFPLSYRCLGNLSLHGTTAWYAPHVWIKSCFPSWNWSGSWWILVQILTSDFKCSSLHSKTRSQEELGLKVDNGHSTPEIHQQDKGKMECFSTPRDENSNW